LSSENVKIIDNFLSIEEADKIEQEFTHPFFPWYYSSSINPEFDHLQEKPNHQFQFVHTFYFKHKIMSNAWPTLEPLIEKMKIKSLVRVKANCIPMTENIITHGFHIDYKDNLTAIYYVNSNNGFTEFETGEKIESSKNRLIIFSSNIKHRGTTSTDAHCRMNININYFPLLEELYGY
jgi:hypothetical protein